MNDQERVLALDLEVERLKSKLTPHQAKPWELVKQRIQNALILGYLIGTKQMTPVDDEVPDFDWDDIYQATLQRRTELLESAREWFIDYLADDSYMGARELLALIEEELDA